MVPYLHAHPVGLVELEVEHAFTSIVRDIEVIMIGITSGSVHKTSSERDAFASIAFEHFDGDVCVEIGRCVVLFFGWSPTWPALTATISDRIATTAIDIFTMDAARFFIVVSPNPMYFNNR
jgi:hypothetical protein